MRNPILELKNIAGGYGPIRVLRDIDLEVYEGEIVSLVGTNGAGKTTLMKTIAALLPQQEGTIIFDGQDISASTTDERVTKGLVLVPEGRQLFAGMNVTENLIMGAYLRRDKAAIKKDLDTVFSLFPRLYERRNHVSGLMSGGEQQMCSIGRALMSKPKFLMIDELSLGLAPIVVERIAEVLVNLNKDTALTIFLVEQDVSVAFNMATRAYVLENGVIVKHGDTDKLRNDPAVKEAYLGL